MSGLTIVIVLTAFANLCLVLLGPVCMGYGIALLIRGRFDTQTPTCAKCHTTLSREMLVAQHSCPACAASPIATAAKRTPAIGRAIWCIALPIAGWLVTVGVLFAAAMFVDD